MARVAAVAVEDSFIFIATVISRLEMTHGTFVGDVVIKKRKTWSLMAKMISFPQTALDDDASEKAMFVGRLNKQGTKGFLCGKGILFEKRGWLCVVSHRALPEEGLGITRKGGERNRE
ncbi:hypothetical protein ACLOJK_014744 [Asimina triloba]